MSDFKTKVKNAYRAMEGLGIPAEKIKPVLKKLLKLYDDDWSLIEAESYRALADAIFEREEESAAELEQPKSSQDSEPAAEPCLKVVNARNEDLVGEEETEALAPPLKRSRLICNEGQSSSLQTYSNGDTQALLPRPKEEPGELPELLPHKVNGSRAVVQSTDSNDINTMVESLVGTYPSLGNGQEKQPIQMSSTTILTENNDKAEDVPLMEAPLAILYPDFSSTIASLTAKHGAIDKDCNLSSDWMKKLSLFGICGLLKNLENKMLDELDTSSLSPYYDIVQDAEKLNFNVKWLRERLDAIRVAIVARHEAKRLEATKNECVVVRKQKLAKLRWHQIQVKEVEDQLTANKLEIEDLNRGINNETAKFQHFETAPLLDGLV